VETEDRLISAALGLFAKDGVDGTNIPNIANRAGVGVGTIYRHFKDKTALVNAAYVHAKTALKHTLEDDLDMTLPPRALFDAFWARLVTFAREEPVMFHFLELQDHAPYLSVKSRAVELSVLTPIFTAVVRFKDVGAFRQDAPVEVIIACIWGAFVGLFKAAGGGYFPLDDDKVTAARDACWRAFTTENFDADAAS
jgi:AcrR family transcriptional regulator